MARLGGKSRKTAQTVVRVDQLFTWKLDSAEQALRHMRRAIFAVKSEKDKLKEAYIEQSIHRPDPNVTAAIIARSDVLIDEALARHPALARKASWERDEDGVFADAALVALGDDRPCFTRRRRCLAEQAQSEPKRIVISTDSNTSASIEMAAAVVAAVRIVQQWQPVELWWQGAWLQSNRTRGYVFHVPLVQGDMDFTKVQFFLSNPFRDSLSYRVMASEAVDRGRGWDECQYQAERSYLERTDHFVDHNGVPSSAVDSYAAYWLGMEPAWRVEYDKAQDAEGALQKIVVPYEATPETPEQRKNREESYAKYRKEQEESDRRRAAERASAVS